MLERVQKIIANSGFCSRRKAEELIEQKKVRVNGNLIKLGDKADPATDKVTIGDFEISAEKKVYIALNKPKGYITTSDDMWDRKKVVDLVNTEERIFPVGRLDRDATGLLFLTNDGGWANRIMHPRYEVEKTYFVLLDKPLDKKEKEQIERGIKLSDGFVKAKIKPIDRNRLEITVHVGKNKIVKRIFNHFGYRVKELCRIRIGNVYLGRLKIGTHRTLAKKEIESFLKK